MSKLLRSDTLCLDSLNIEDPFDVASLSNVIQNL